MKKNLVLLGMMGVGKSTLGKIVAKRQNLDFEDIDSNIEKKNLMTVKEIFKKKGEQFFRTKEELEVLKCLKKNNCVIALGGGAFINPTIRAAVLKNSISIWLDIDLKIIKQRIKWNKKRPLLMNTNIQKKIEDLYAERKHFYNMANHKIACGKLNKEDITKKIITIYEKY